MLVLNLIKYLNILDYQTPNVFVASDIKLTVMLTSDPLNGPYSATVDVQVGQLVSIIALAKLTAAPRCIMNVSFGDSSPDQVSTLTGLMATLAKNYSTPGTYTIVATPVSCSYPNATITIVNNNITVIVSPIANYQGSFLLLF